MCRRGLLDDTHPVTDAAFADFVAETGYVTKGERPLDPADYPDALAEDLIPAGWCSIDRSVVFRWTISHSGGRTCRARTGVRRGGPVLVLPVSTTTRWCRSPTKMPRPSPAGVVCGCPRKRNGNGGAGGLESAAYSWGMSPIRTAGRWRTLAGRVSLAEPGPRWLGVHVTGRLVPANGYGLFDMAGNVWEWTTDWWQDRHRAVHACCGPTVDRHTGWARRRRAKRSVGRSSRAARTCAPRTTASDFAPPPADPQEPVDTSTCHIGFRCAATVQT